MSDFTVLLIATNKYVDYAKELLVSIEEKLFPKSTGQVIVFTDQPGLFSKTGSSRVAVTAAEIPSYGWPEATLLRYQIFEDNWNLVEGTYVMYLDVDTVVASVVELDEVFDDKSDDDLAFVRHPGYYKTSLYSALIARSPIGTWETRRASTAHVPVHRRKTYVAGGVWIGTNDAIRNMVGALRRNVDQDLAIDIVAKWHDESHLNAWASTHKARHLSPAWAYAPGYKNLVGLEPIIQLVHKPEEFFTQRN
jgi:hypothetical protein